MARVFINKGSQSVLKKISTNMPHAILLHGISGVGLMTVARYISGNDISHIEIPVTKKGEVSSLSGTISAEKIRNLYENTRTKHNKRRIIIIDDADTMSPAAQNAFLKLLEEPNDSTHFILTSHHPEKLLPTVRSRVQSFMIAPLSGAETNDILDLNKVFDTKKRSQLIFLANGLPAEINRLLNDERYFTQRAETVANARDFIQSKPYKKLQIIAKYHSDRTASLELLELSIKILRLSLEKSSDQTVVYKIDRLSKVYENISSNMNNRLQLMRAMY